MSKQQEKDKKENSGFDTVDISSSNESPETEEEKKSATDAGSESVGDETSVDKQLAEALSEAADLKDKMLRLAADYENYKKRSERERAQAMKYAGEHIFREILSVVDNLERALKQGVVDGADAEKNLAALLEGVELTFKSLVSTLEKFEVKPVDSIGEPFDPNKQEALAMEPSETIPVNHVVSEYEKGYFYKDRLLRAAKVTVSSGNAES